MNLPSASPRPPPGKTAWVVGVILLTAAVSGYFMGLRQTGSTLRMPEPVSAITPDSVRRAAAVPEAVPVAVRYADQNWLAHGRNAGWQSTLAQLIQPPAPPLPPPDFTVPEADRERAREERAKRRAFDGAPPVVPHPIVQDASAACLACHGPGLVIKDRVAPRISHDPYASCTQCHVPNSGPPVSTAWTPLADPLTRNLFTAGPGFGRGDRAWPEAPPTIPHPTAMRSDCLSCHGPTGLFGLRTPHPDRQSCTQCHVPNADLDQHWFLTWLGGRPTEEGSIAGNHPFPPPGRTP